MKRSGRIDSLWPRIAWLDRDSVLVVDLIDEVIGDLKGKEHALATNMSKGRAREFIAGRTVARRALRNLQPSCEAEILIGVGGEPIWPPDISGSLSHTSSFVAALVARSCMHPSVGIDLDDPRPIDSHAAREIMTEDEVAAVLSACWTSDFAIARNLVFLAKESFFKFQFPLTQIRDLDFDAVRLRASETIGALEVSPRADVPIVDGVCRRARIFVLEIHGVRMCYTVVV